MLQPTPLSIQWQSQPTLGLRAFYLWGFGFSSCQFGNGGGLQSGKTFRGIKVILWELPLTWRQKQTSLGLCWSGFHLFWRQNSSTPPLQSRIALIARRCPRSWHEQALTCFVCILWPGSQTLLLAQNAICISIENVKGGLSSWQPSFWCIWSRILKSRVRFVIIYSFTNFSAAPQSVFGSVDRLVSSRKSTESAISFSIPDHFHLAKASEFGTAAREVASAHDIFALFVLRFSFQCCSKWKKSGIATNVVIQRSLRLEPGRAFLERSKLFLNFLYVWQTASE